MSFYLSSTFGHVGQVAISIAQSRHKRKRYNPVQQELTIQGVQLGKLQPITNSSLDGLTFTDSQDFELIESEDFTITLYNFANAKR